ncbi:YxiF family protein [Sporosarcina limicola]
MDITKFTIGYGDFILVADDLKFGICIERTEYQYEFYSWGVTE